MGVSQIQSSFQNDGNFSQLDLRDEAHDGPLLRIETFRCSQPEGEFGTTASGTSVNALAGADHLKSGSNGCFRHIFSSGDSNNPTVTLEIRETYDEDGSLEVRTRDVDSDSKTFGWVLLTSAKPTGDGIEYQCQVFRPDRAAPVRVPSPLPGSISEMASGLPDIGDAPDALGKAYPVAGMEALQAILVPGADNTAALGELDRFGSALREVAPRWAENVCIYERMGDFRDKCIHPGTNLTGPHAALASEYVLIRAYRMSLITLGRVFDESMAAGVETLNIDDALSVDPKPGVYSVFLSAYALNIGHYQLGLDKVHSDYGGVPMALKPGSRLETGARPVVDSTNLNRMLALLAGLFYAPASVSGTMGVKPAIAGFTTPAAMSFLT